MDNSREKKKYQPLRSIYKPTSGNCKRYNQ